MKLHSITLSGYRQFLEPTTLQFPAGLTGICGPNGVGKSKLIEAIGFALYGSRSNILPKGDYLKDLASSAAPEGVRVVPRVELEVEVGGQRYEIIRTSAPAQALIRLKGAADPLAETSRAVTTKVIELLRLPPAAYLGTFVARQKEIAGLQNLDPQPRHRLVNRLIGITLVEEAIKLARETQERRRSRWSAASEALLCTAEAAEAAAQERQAELDQAVQEGRASREALDAARGKWQEAARLLEGRRTQTAQAEAQQRELARLREHLGTLQTALQSTQRQVAEAAQAEAELGTIRATLEQTTAAQEALAWQERLAAVAELRSRQQGLQQELERLRPLQARRQALLALVQERERELQALQDQLGERLQQSASTAQQAQSAREEAARHERRGQTAAELGREGECDTCGQRFGDNLEQALGHYAQEAAAAREREVQALVCHRKMKETADHLQAELRQIQAELQTKKSELIEYETVPGEEAQARQAFDRLEAELADQPWELLSASYDPQAHQLAAAAVGRRQEALVATERLQALAASGATARENEAALQQQLLQRQAQAVALEAEITHITPPPGALDEAEAAVAQEEAALRVAEAVDRAAAEQLASSRARREAADGALDRAREQERGIAAAYRELLIAERTEALLTRLLEEITSEARPRLAELMEGWGRALLGPHFRRIELSPDYRIRADNGSGPHFLEHFSGGEQTLLALMLRVAISIFCQERAGFDAGFLILDEVFGDQDGDHRSQLLQFLEEIREHYHQVLVVNHVEDVTSLLDSIIAVTPTGDRTSRAAFQV